MDAENERVTSEGEHKKMAALYADIQEKVNEQYKENKRSIAKSKYDLLHMLSASCYYITLNTHATRRELCMKVYHA